MEELNYKTEIEQSRTGSLGSSDAAMVERIGRNGISALSETDKYRLAVLKGQAENVNVKTYAMELGDNIEQTIYGIIHDKFPQALSNPLREDKQMSKFYGFNIINHIDVEVETADSIAWYEIKASKHDTVEVQETYAAQLQWHWMLLKKIYGHSGKKLSLHLVHYKTGVSSTFEASNMSLVDIPDNTELEGLFYAGFMALRDFLPTYEYKPSENVSIALVEDEYVQSIREEAERYILQIADMQKVVDEFRDRMKNYMVEHDIKKIVGDNYSITLTSAAQTTSLDSKKLKAENPEIYNKYARTSTRAASVSIRVNDNTNN